MTQETCPCGSGAVYASCCAPYIAGEAPAPTAQALMRSRYTAHVKLAAEYLNATQRGQRLATFSRMDMEHSARSMRWVGLKVVAASGGGEGDKEGTVEFIASFEKDGQPGTHHEKSSFVRDGQAWLYTSGKNPQKPVRRDAVKVGRNQPCPCGSGKKYKRCCGTG